jgi:CheY-like chemotaxis protein
MAPQAGFAGNQSYEASPVSSNSTTTPATILLVEDDGDSRAALQAVLETARHTVIPAGSVREALDLLDQHAAIELVISDIRMPDVDGLDFIRVLRHRFPALPTILVSGMPITDDDVVPREATQILTKPVSFEDLERAIAERSRRGSAGRAMQNGPAPRKRS